MTDIPTLVSFYGGRPYYYEAAQCLRADCERLGVPHDIVELSSTDGLDWAQICRLKINFYREMLAKHGPILWVDVDARLLRRPDVLEGCRFDLAGFAGRYRYIREYNPYETARFWVPSVLMFNDTPNGRAFVDLMSTIERETPDDVTDDYVLQEAWTRFPGQLNLGFLAPRLASRSRESAEDAIFLLGDSGNVGTYRAQVVQHDNAAADPRLRATVLNADAIDAMKAGDRSTALLLAERAATYQPDDVAIVGRYAEYLRQSKRADEARDVIIAFVDRNPDSVQMRHTLIRHATMASRWDLAEQHLSILLDDAQPPVLAQAQSAAFDIDLERRAAERGLGSKDRVGMWWPKTPYPGDFGNLLGPYVVEKLSGAPPRYTSPQAGMIASGSTVRFAKKGTVVWGAGTARMSDQLAAEAEYRAVRGPLTRKAVHDSGGTCPDLYGDPALLLPRYYQPREVRKEYRLGLVHQADQSHPLSPGVRDISLARAGFDGVEAVIDEMLSCEAILATSVSGLIAAHAYGIPVRCCALGDDPDRIEFEDYLRAVGLPVHPPLDLSQFDIIDEQQASSVDHDVELSFDAAGFVAAFQRR